MGASPKPKFNDIKKLPPLFFQSLVVVAKIPGVKIRVYDTASAIVHGEDLSELKSYNAMVKVSYPAFLIEHPIHGPLLFDTGPHPSLLDLSKRKAKRMKGTFRVPLKQEPGQNIVSQLRADGISKNKIGWIFLSHLHLDHSGMIESFPNATIVVNQQEWVAQENRIRNAQKKIYYEFRPAEMKDKIRLKLVDLTEAPSFASFDHGLDFFKDGTVILVNLPGHTPGNMGAWLNLDSGPVLLAGDATWIYDNHEDLATPKKETIRDWSSYWRSIHTMRVAKSGVPALVIFPGHDLSPLMIQPRKDVTKAPFPR